MKYCLNCRRLWPAQAQICGSCRCSFGGRLCSSKHLSPAGSVCCVTCGSRKLLQHARYVNLSLPVILASWLVGLLLLKLLISNIGALVAFVIGGIEVVGSFLLGQSLGAFFGGIFQITVVCALIWLAFRRILGRNSFPVKAFESLLRQCARQAPHLIRWTTKMLLRAISGSQKQSGSSPDTRRD